MIVIITRWFGMPEEIIYNNIDEAVEKVKKKTTNIIECRVKVNRDNVKVKVRSKKKLYTIVLDKEITGIENIDELKKTAEEIVSKLGCQENKVVIK